MTGYRRGSLRTGEKCYDTEIGKIEGVNDRKKNTQGREGQIIRLNDLTTALFGKSFAKTFDGIPQGIAENGGEM